MDKVELKLVGITYNQIESGVYALILEDTSSNRRLAIVIGYPEAQSIECHLQNIRTPRPLSHDVMASLINRLNAHLQFIFIHKLPGGPYAANLHIIDEIGREIIVDSRSSDAVALAIRMNAPIYTSTELMETEGFKPEERKKVKPVEKNNLASGQLKNVDLTLKKMSSKKLKDYIAECVKSEKYEEAAKAKKELESRGDLPNIIID